MPGTSQQGGLPRGTQDRLTRFTSAKTGIGPIIDLLQTGRMKAGGETYPRGNQRRARLLRKRI